MTWPDLERLLMAATEAEDEESQLEVMSMMWERERVEAEEMERATRGNIYPAFLYAECAES